MPAKPTPQARVPRSLSVPADLDAAWSAALDARGESRPQWIARHVQEDQAGTVQKLREALVMALAEIEHHNANDGDMCCICEGGVDAHGAIKHLDSCVVSQARAALAATKEE